MRTLVVACVLMLVYAESTTGNSIASVKSVSDIIKGVISGKTKCNQSLTGVTGPELIDCVEICGHKPYTEMNDTEACDSLTCAGYAYKAVNKNEIDIVKVILMCYTCATPLTNRKMCLINTIACYNEVNLLYGAEKVEKFFQCVVNLQTMNYIDKK